MSPGRMVAALAAALCFGAIAASLAGSGAPAGFAAVAAVIAFLGAVAIAALLTLPVVAIRALRDGRLALPGGGVLAAALVAGGLVTFPMYSNFYVDASSAAEDSQVGYCDGVLPLAQVVRNSVADDPYAAVSYFAGCQD